MREKRLRSAVFKLPNLKPLKKWVETTRVLGASALEEYCKTNEASPVLLQAAKWSHEVNENIERIVRNVPPLPNVKESLKKIKEFADIVIVSATPHEAIVREWEENWLLEYVDVVAGQEMGTKEECIRTANANRYDLDKVLMIGDAPGDKRAAFKNGVMFRPIIPGMESESWNLILNEDAESFRNGTYKDKVMQKRIDQFHSVLQRNPPWEA